MSNSVIEFQTLFLMSRQHRNRIWKLQENENEEMKETVFLLLRSISCQSARVKVIPLIYIQCTEKCLVSNKLWASF